VLLEAVRLTDLQGPPSPVSRGMLDHVAGRERTTVSGVLARELDGVASAEAEELACAIPGFAAALAWPGADAAQLREE
jgi:hypothetical protein